MTEPKGLSNRLVLSLIIVLAGGIIFIGSSATYSAWVSSRNHHTNCTRIGSLADAVQNIVVSFLTPQPGHTYTATQVKQVTDAEAKSAAFLDKARC